MSHTLGRCIDCNIYINTEQDFNEHWRHHWVFLKYSKEAKLSLKHKFINFLKEKRCALFGHQFFHHTYSSKENFTGGILLTWLCKRCLFYKTYTI